jgi:hypothetical protein
VVRLSKLLWLLPSGDSDLDMLLFGLGYCGDCE